MPYARPDDPANIEKARKSRREYYKRNKTSEIKRIKARIRSITEWIQEYKSHLKCSKCPESHPACLDFHHTDPSTKRIEISQVARSKGWSLDKVKEEIDKCEVLCSNCHRKEHLGRPSAGDQVSKTRLSGLDTHATCKDR